MGIFEEAMNILLGTVRLVLNNVHFFIVAVLLVFAYALLATGGRTISTMFLVIAVIIVGGIGKRR